MDSIDAISVKDFLSCMSCSRLVSIVRPETINSENSCRRDRGLNGGARFQTTVCYICETDGVAVPARRKNDFDMTPTIQQSSSTIESSVKFKAARKMVEHTLGLDSNNGRVTVHHRDDVLHSYGVGCKIVTVNVYESVNETAVESAYLETGFS